jgi:hypothetical protein
MTRDEIKQLALDCGFALREQQFGGVDLYPHVYNFSERLIEAVIEKMKAEGWRKCAKGQHTTQFCGQLEQAVLAEREACAQVCDGFVRRRQPTCFGELIAAEIRARSKQ